MSNIIPMAPASDVLPDKTPKVRVLLGMPTYKFLTAVAFSYHMGMLLDSVNSGYLKRLQMEADMYVTMARNTMCATALDLYHKKEVTHLWMVDDDMLIPSGTLAKLVSRNVPVVGAAYYRRDVVPVAYTLDPFKFFDRIPKTGAMEVEGTGGGCLLIHCEVLEHMQKHFKDQWWFQNTIAKGKNGQESYLGEDVFFFRRLHEMGIKTVLDCDVQCGHIGVSIVDREIFELKNGLKDFVPEPVRELLKSAAC